MKRIVLKILSQENYLISNKDGKFGYPLSDSILDKKIFIKFLNSKNLKRNKLPLNIEKKECLRIRENGENWLNYYDKKYGGGNGIISREMLKRIFYLDKKFNL